MELTAVYLAAGLSSRFGGKIKALVKVGHNNETLLEISMNQAIKSGFNNFVFVVSNKTVQPIKEFFGDSFNNIPIRYCFQETPEYRKKPFGTAHAVISSRNLADGSFMILNSDDIYGKETLKNTADYLKRTKGYCLPGFKLKNCLPEKGSVNRGLIKVDKNNNLVSITELFNLSRSDIPSKYSGNELVSMNLFGMQPDFLDFCEDAFKKFLKEYKDDPTIEFLLPDAVTIFKNEKKKDIAVIQTNDIPTGITNPEDEQKVRDLLKHKTL